ncbi:hypothetical protein ACFQ0B_07195 [Nonomuraea thailandensis]
MVLLKEDFSMMFSQVAALRRALPAVRDAARASAGTSESPNRPPAAAAEPMVMSLRRLIVPSDMRSFLSDGCERLRGRSRSRGRPPRS